MWLWWRQWLPHVTDFCSSFYFRYILGFYFFFSYFCLETWELHAVIITHMKNNEIKTTVARGRGGFPRTGSIKSSQKTAGEFYCLAWWRLLLLLERFVFWPLGGTVDHFCFVLETLAHWSRCAHLGSVVLALAWPRSRNGSGFWT